MWCLPWYCQCESQLSCCCSCMSPYFQNGPVRTQILHMRQVKTSQPGGTQGTGSASLLDHPSASLKHRGNRETPPQIRSLLFSPTSSCVTFFCNKFAHSQTHQAWQRPVQPPPQQWVGGHLCNKSAVQHLCQTCVLQTTWPAVNQTHS